MNNMLRVDYVRMQAARFLNSAPGFYYGGEYVTDFLSAFWFRAWISSFYNPSNYILFSLFGIIDSKSFSPNEITKNIIINNVLGFLVLSILYWLAIIVSILTDIMFKVPYLLVKRAEIKGLYKEIVSPHTDVVDWNNAPDYINEFFRRRVERIEEAKKLASIV